MKKYLLGLALVVLSLFLDAQNQENTSLRIALVGDVMLGTNYPNENYLSKNPYNLIKVARPILESSDLSLGNLEGAMTDKIENQKVCRDPKYCYLFNMPTAYASILSEVGFDGMSLANNHSGDFGRLGRERTIFFLKNAGIETYGVQQKKYAIVHRKGLKIGLIAFSPNKETLDITNLEAAKKLVKDLDNLVDMVIVSAHMGAEGKHSPRNLTSETEVYLGENRGNPLAFAHSVIDAGADLVYAHGPHFPRSIELYKGKLIAYSLGNFLTYGRFNLDQDRKYAPILEVTLNQEGDFVQGYLHSFFQNYIRGLVKDSTKKVFAHIQRLSQIDFPNQNLKFNDGFIYRE